MTPLRIWQSAALNLLIWAVKSSVPFWNLPGFTNV